MLRLTQKEQVLGERLESACQESTELRANLASLHARLARHDQLNQQHAQQVLAMQIRDPVVLKRARPPCKTWRVGARVNEQASVATGKFRLCFGATGFQSCFLKFHTRSESWNLALQDVLQHANVDLPRDCRVAAFPAAAANLTQAPFAVVSFISSRAVSGVLFFFFQLAQAWQEVEVAKSRAQQLQDEVEELQEKVQVAGNHGDVSLLSELEISLEAADLRVSEEEVSHHCYGSS